jgi:hypothetical protein
MRCDLHFAVRKVAGLELGVVLVVGGHGCGSGGGGYVGVGSEVQERGRVGQEGGVKKGSGVFILARRFFSVLV